MSKESNQERIDAEQEAHELNVFLHSVQRLVDSVGNLKNAVQSENEEQIVRSMGKLFAEYNRIMALSADEEEPEIEEPVDTTPRLILPS